MRNRLQRFSWLVVLAAFCAGPLAWAAALPAPPVLQSAALRHQHGAAGEIDLALSLVTTNPTIEPRQSPFATLVLTFDKPVVAADAFVIEGTATAGVPTFSGNQVTVGLTDVANVQYVTIAVTDVASADGGSGGSHSVRVGFLAGDVDQNRVVTLSDMLAVNAVLTQTVGAVNFLRDVDRSGALTISDKLVVNASLTQFLPAAVAAANQPPAVSAGATAATVTLPAQASLTGAVTDDGLPAVPGVVTTAWSKVSGPGTVTFGNVAAVNTSASFSIDGTYVLELAAFDGQLTNAATVTITVSPVGGGGGLPPDPASVAPANNPAVPTNIFTSTAFLYTGDNPIQTDVVPGTIDAERAAVLRGTVRTRDGAALSGVIISILRHPEFGQTKSRADGAFDMAVNGGGLLTVKYRKTGYLPVQRAVVAPWRDFAALPDVVMIPLDTAVTAVTLSGASPLQSARGNPVADVDGTRRATVLFPAGTTATLVMPDGSTQPISTLNIRATEYTVGATGPSAMPGALPPASGYTYAVELSVDEAIGAGAASVQFSQAVPTYVENFLAFPVGTLVPSGFYDHATGQWVASTNGRVIKVLAITGGFADLDLDGSNTTAGAGALATLGITDAERQRLALLYTAGQSLWRVPVQHFSPWDFNYPYGPPPGAKPPSGAPPPAPGPQPDGPPKGDPDEDCGSVIGCERQTLGQLVGVAGTGVYLHYQSDRVPGRRDATSLRIRLSGASLPPDLQRIHLEVSVAGQVSRKVFTPQANLFDTFIWDGKDAYGRPAQGQHPVRVRIGYEYIAQYYDTPDSFAASFNRFGSPPLADGGGGEVIFARSPVRTATPPIILWQDYEAAPLGQLTTTGLGGWTLSIHHQYDVARRTLYLGTGERRGDIDATALIITTVAGTGTPGFTGDGGPATAARVDSPQSVVAAPDGSLYIVANGRVRRVAPDGTITTVAGNGGFGFSGDGGPATLARFAFITGIALGPDGSLYIGDFNNSRIRRVAPNGIISTFAGNGVYGYSGDGGPATQAAMQQPQGVAVGPDGSVYFSDSGTQRVRRVATDGTITTFAGNGQSTGVTVGDGGPATKAYLAFPEGIAAGADGALYIADRAHVRVRRVGTDGIITTIAGSGSFSFSGDGGPAVAAAMGLVNAVTTSLDGSVFISDFDNQRIRRVGPNGVITTAAGSGNAGFTGDGGPAAQGRINSAHGIAARSDGSFYIADTNNNRIRLVRPVIPGIFVGDTVIASQDGTELYVFTDTGRHRRTLDALNGNVRFEFAYDSAGGLTSITDLNGKVITVTRDGSGNPTAIVAPYGQQTTLTMSAGGYLASITNPAGQATQLTYFTGGAAGLLQTLTDARGKLHQYQYDALGRLTRDETPAGGVKILARTELGDNHYQVTVTTSSGLVTTHEVEGLPSGVTRRVRTGASGAATVTLLRPDATRRVTYPDGSIADDVAGPDPRFGMQASILTSQTLTTPGFKSQVVTRTQDVTLADPNNLLSLVTRTSTLTIDGRTTTTTYTASPPAMSFQTPAGRTGGATLDAKGHVTQTQVTGLAPTLFAYTADGRISTVTEGTGGSARTTTLTYGNAGPGAAYLAQIDDALARATSLAYDAAGRATQRTLPGARIVGYGYDANGGLTSLTPPGGAAHVFTWTDDQRMATYTPPAAPGGGGPVTYGYDVDRRLAQVVQPDGQVVGVAYDAAGRPVQLSQPGRAINVTYQGTTANVQAISGPAGQQVAYSADGPMLVGQTWSGPIAGTVSRTLDNGLRTLTRTVNAAAVSLTYDQDSLLTGAGALTLARHPAHGLVSATTLGIVTDTRAYSGFGALDHYVASASGTPFFDVQLTRDALGRVTTRSETVGGITDTYAYGYDAAGRLTQVQKNAATTHTYTYDANGNRLTANGAAAAYDSQDRQTQAGTTTYVHTQNGERQAKTAPGGTTTYAYDAIGNLLNVTLPDATQVAYVVDGLSRRVGKKVGGTLVQGWLYDERGRIVAELDGAGAVVNRFVYASRSNVPDYMVRGGVNYRLVSDPLGTVRFVVKASDGTVAQQLAYDPFGSVSTDTAPGFQPFGFAGGLYDRDTLLVRFGARDYDPATGRWTTKDPILFAGGDTNLYAYAGNDPVNRRDANGLDGPSDGGVCLGPPPDLPLGKPLFLDEELGPPEAPQPPICPTCAIPAAPSGAGGAGGGPSGPDASLNFGPFKFSGDLNFPGIGDLRDWNPKSLFDKFGLKLDSPLNPDFKPPDTRKSPGSPDPNGPNPKPQGPQCNREPSHDPGFTSCQ